MINKELLSKHQRQIRFVLVGIWNTIFGYGAFCLLYMLFQPLFRIQYFAYTLAQVVGICVSQINSFIGHKYITFKSPVKGIGILFEFFRFCMTYAVTYVLDFTLLPFFVEVLHVHPILGAALIMPIRVIVSYVGHSRFSFAKRNPIG